MGDLVYQARCRPLDWRYSGGVRLTAVSLQYGCRVRDSYAESEADFKELDIGELIPHGKNTKFYIYNIPRSQFAVAVLETTSPLRNSNLPSVAPPPPAGSNLPRQPLYLLDMKSGTLLGTFEVRTFSAEVSASSNGRLVSITCKSPDPLLPNSDDEGHAVVFEIPSCLELMRVAGVVKARFVPNEDHLLAILRCAEKKGKEGNVLGCVELLHVPDGTCHHKFDMCAVAASGYPHHQSLYLSSAGTYLCLPCLPKSVQLLNLKKRVNVCSFSLTFFADGNQLWCEFTPDEAFVLVIRLKNVPVGVGHIAIFSTASPELLKLVNIDVPNACAWHLNEDGKTFKVAEADPCIDSKVKPDERILVKSFAIQF